MVRLSSRLARAFTRLFDQSAVVYTRGAGGTFTTVVKSGLACRLDPTNRVGFGASTGPTRAEPAPDATLFWTADYEMPENAQITVDAFGATRWNVVAGTVMAEVAPGGVVLARYASVVRAK